MSDNFFAYISRMRYIVRWSLMRNSLPENIQEHSHMVAVIAHALGVIRRDVMGVPCDPNEAAVVALFHDSSEILTGDLPTPIKYHSEEIKGAYRQVENLACNMLLDTLPDELRGAYEPLLTGETQERLHDIVKAAASRSSLATYATASISAVCAPRSSMTLTKTTRSGNLTRIRQSRSCTQHSLENREVRRRIICYIPRM